MARRFPYLRPKYNVLFFDSEWRELAFPSMYDVSIDQVKGALFAWHHLQVNREAGTSDGPTIYDEAISLTVEVSRGDEEERQGQAEGGSGIVPERRRNSPPGR